MPDTPYIVLARKHRPKHFSDVVGQDHIGRTLSNAIEQGRVAHALLFTGARGVGKTSTARILARALNCQQGPTPTPCDECAACREIASGASVDVIEIDAASNRGIDEIRDLREAVRYPPSRERYKVYIIDEVHMLTVQAFNALLKTLEEPPARVVFIFATTEPHKIPDTILSRCQRFDFRRIPVKLIAEHLTRLVALEDVDAEPAALRLIAQQAEGCMRDAQSLLDQLISFSDGKIDAQLASRVLGVVGRDTLFRLSEAVLEHDVDAVLDIVERAYEAGANLVRLASDFLAHLRDLTVAAVSRAGKGLDHLSSDEQAALRGQAKRSQTTVLHRLFTILLETTEEMSRSAYPRLMLEMALIRMTSVEPVEPLGGLIERIETLAGRMGGGGTAHRVTSAAAASAPATPEAGRSGADDAGAGTSPLPTRAQPARPEVRSSAPPTPAPQATAATPAPAARPATPSPTGHTGRWRHLVETVGERSRPVAGILKVAELLSESGATFRAGLAGAHHDILQDSAKLTLVETVATELYGPDARVKIEQVDRSVDTGETARYSVESAEEEARRAERQKLDDMIRNHPATAIIRDVFEPEEVRVTPRVLADGENLETDR
jgi:DNA polymerase-3 subunit gamma/tau